LNAKERKERSLTLLDRVGIKARADHLPSQLSGGEQQRVTIARAIANKPDILLLDEPTGDLDTYNTMVVMDMLLRLNETEGITMVMVTHDPNLKFLASRVVYMRDGRVFRDDPVDPEIRRLEIAKLNGELNAARVERQMRSGQHGDQAAIDETSGEVQVPFTDATEFRKPQDYHTFVAQRPLAEEELAMGRRREQNFAQFLQGGSASSSAASGPVASSSASSSASASNSVRA
jgi:putative ABC transport system ATP-binding protein